VNCDNCGNARFTSGVKPIRPRLRTESEGSTTKVLARSSKTTHTCIPSSSLPSELSKPLPSSSTYVTFARRIFNIHDLQYFLNPSQSFSEHFTRQCSANSEHSHADPTHLSANATQKISLLPSPPAQSLRLRRRRVVRKTREGFHLQGFRGGLFRAKPSQDIFAAGCIRNKPSERSPQSHSNKPPAYNASDRANTL
jgi:hypothetical protein